MIKFKDRERMRRSTSLSTANIVLSFFYKGGRRHTLSNACGPWKQCARCPELLGSRRCALLSPATKGARNIDGFWRLIPPTTVGKKTSFAVLRARFACQLQQCSQREDGDCMCIMAEEPSTWILYAACRSLHLHQTHLARRWRAFIALPLR